MPDEQLGAVLDLDISSSLSSVEALGAAIEATLSDSVSVFSADMASAVDAVPAVDLAVEPDVADVEPAITGAVDAADGTVEVDATGAEAITGDIDAAVSSADTQIEVTADTTAADGAINSISAEPIMLEVDADTTDASAALDSLGSAGTAAGGGMSAASKGAEEMGHATEFASISAGLAVGETEHLTSAAQGAGGSLGVATGAGVAFAGALGEMFSAGVNATGAAQRFNTILGQQKDAVEQVNVGNLNENLGELGMSLGTTRAEMENSTASTFQFATVSGAGGDAAGTFSERIAALSARAVALNPNLGSVGDVAETMSTRLARGGRFAAGFGISLTAAEINARALADTGKTAASDLSLYEKAAAGAALATEKYGSSLEGTIKSGTENAIIQQRKLKAEFEEIIESLGSAIVIPIFDLIRAGMPVVEAFGRIVQTLAVGALPVMTAALEAVTVPLNLLADALQFASPLIGPLVAGFIAFEAASVATTAVTALGVALGILPGELTAASTVNALFAASEIAVGEAAIEEGVAIEASTAAMDVNPVLLLVSALAAGAAAMGLFGSSGRSAKESTKAFADELATTADEALTRKFNAAVDKAAFAMDTLGVHTSKPTLALQEFKRIAEENVGTAQRLLTAMQASGQNTDGYAAALDRAVASENKHKTAQGETDAAQQQLTGSTQAGTAATEAQTAAQDAATQAVDAYVSKVSGAMPTAASAFDNTASAASHFGASMSPEALLSGLQDSLNQIVSFTGNIKTIFDAGFTDLGALLQEKGAAAGGGMAQALADEIRNHQTDTASALNTTAQQVNVAGAVAANYATTQGGIVVANTAAEYAKLSPTVAFYMGLSAQEVANATGYLAPAAAAAANVGVVLPFGAHLSEIPGNAAGAMQNTAGAVTGSTGTLTGAGEGAGGGVAGGFGRGVAPIPGQAGAAVSGAAGPIQSAGASLASRDAFSAGYGVGESFDAGMQIGILTNMGPIISAAVQAVNTAESAARAAADGHSPSRLFMALGGDLSEGMAIGIGDGEDQVAIAARALVARAENITRAAAMGIAVPAGAYSMPGIGSVRGAGAGQTIAFNINVHGVTDPATARNVGEQIGEGAVDALSRRGYVVTARLG